jgi:hypothetical protein
MLARSFRPEILLISMAAILLEIGYTRIFSYKLYYYCPSRCEPCVDACHEYGVPPIQGCATERRSSTSTLA